MNATIEPTLPRRFNPSDLDEQEPRPTRRQSEPVAHRQVRNDRSAPSAAGFGGAVNDNDLLPDMGRRVNDRTMEVSTWGPRQRAEPTPPSWWLRFCCWLSRL